MDRVTSLLMVLFTRMMGFGAPWTFVDDKYDIGEAPGFPRLPYLLIARRRAFGRHWAVYNGISDHVVASGLSRKRAAVLCTVLNAAAAS